MRLHRHEGLWCLGDPMQDPAPLVLTVQTEGALVQWPLGARPGVAPTITLVDAHACGWLWRLVGEDGERAIRSALARGGGDDLGLRLDPKTCGALHRLAHALWVGSWWPTSTVDAIPAVDPIVLAAESAVLADELDGIVDADAEFVAVPPHAPAHLRALAALADVGTASDLEALAERAASLLEDAGLAPAAAPALTRADLALAARGAAASLGAPGEMLAEGWGPVPWQGVPAGLVDSTEDAVHWWVDAAGRVTVHVRVRVLDGAPVPAEGIEVRVGLPSGERAEGVLDAAGRAVVELPLAPTLAWTQDWQHVMVHVGVPVAEDRALRERVRRATRQRLAVTDELTLLAEKLLHDLDF